AETLGCRASALLAQLVEHFHGKEGDVGSRPTEGLCGPPLVAQDMPTGDPANLALGASMEAFWKPLRQRVVRLVDGLGLEDGIVAVLQVLDVRAISLEPDSIHSLAGDGPG